MRDPIIEEYGRSQEIIDLVSEGIAEDPEMLIRRSSHMLHLLGPQHGVFYTRIQL